jgi:hypothetical protein
MKILQRRRFFGLVLGISLGISLLAIGQLVMNVAWADDNSQAAKDKRVAELKQKIESIQYGAKKPKAIVYVFTDMNCTYCRKLHHEFPKLAEQGIQVRVLAMPRQGLDSPGYKEWVSIWCSNDQNDSLDRAMEGEDIAPKTCKNPIKMHYTLGRKWGVIGTPSVLFADGTLKAGYFPADRLAREAIKRSAEMEKEDGKDAAATSSPADKTVKTEKKDEKPALDKGKEKDKDKDKDKNKDAVKNTDQGKQKEQDKDKDKSKNKDKDKDQSKDKEAKAAKDVSKDKANDKANDKTNEKSDAKKDAKTDAKLNSKP